jgi:hypothetical protein
MPLTSIFVVFSYGALSPNSLLTITQRLIENGLVEVTRCELLNIDVPLTVADFDGYLVELILLLDENESDAEKGSLAVKVSLPLGNKKSRRQLRRFFITLVSVFLKFVWHLIYSKVRPFPPDTPVL